MADQDPELQSIKNHKQETYQQRLQKREDGRKKEEEEEEKAEQQHRPVTELCKRGFEQGEGEGEATNPTDPSPQATCALKLIAQ